MCEAGGESEAPESVRAAGSVLSLNSRSSLTSELLLLVFSWFMITWSLLFAEVDYNLKAVSWFLKG